MNNNQIQFKCVFRYSLVQCLYYYCGALSISLNGSSGGRDVSPVATPAQLVLANYNEPDLNGHFDDCTKNVSKELHVQEEEMSDSDEKSSEVDDK